jgi:hypothetical protein
MSRAGKTEEERNSLEAGSDESLFCYPFTGCLLLPCCMRREEGEDRKRIPERADGGRGKPKRTII